LSNIVTLILDLDKASNRFRFENLDPIKKENQKSGFVSLVFSNLILRPQPFFNSVNAVCLNSNVIESIIRLMKAGQTPDPPLSP
jgi:hypothetical protein